MDTRFRIELLGGLRIEQGNRVITRFRTQKTAALLAYLAYYRERSHPREHLIDLLWPEADLASGRNSLSIALSSLRHQLEPPGVPHGTILRADRSSVQLNPEAVNIDVAEFEVALQKAAQAGSANERILFLTSAVELYGGELLPGFYEEWCLTERERLVGTYLGALHQVVEALERTGDLDRALSYARRAVSADPLREEGHQHVMRLLAAAGQPTAALRQYRELEQLLDEQLGEAPSAITRQVALAIERQTTRRTASPRQVEPATAAGRRRPSALPARLPTGTVTFLLTDLEGSTAQWERGAEAFTAALASHHTLLRRTFRRFGGYEVKEAGDGFIVAFERAGDALACGVAVQRALAEHPWPQEVGPLRARMALHTGDVELQEGDYHGLVLHHASRMLAAGHGGQILCSEATAVVVQRKLEPGTWLTDLGVYRLRDVEHPERFFQVEYPEMAQRVFPPLRAEAGHARNLPLQFTRFIGREQELGQLEELLLAGPTRLVTLTGPGGTGKSRLALELASRLVERFQGAVWFVALADLLDPQRIVDALLDALRLPRSPSREPLDQVVEMLSRQPSLLVLDNFEHLVEDGASVVQTLLQRVPALKCLVTSRQLLGLSGEREFVVPALQTPAGAPRPSRQGAPPASLTLEQLSMYESVQLFIDRAQVVRPDFQVTNQNAAAVAELCNRLEGIPLALELAAARAQVLTPGQMLRQLAHRFDFLVSRKRDGVKRHQTLHAAMDWSYRLLPPELQRFFARLSVFRGGWTLQAAEELCEEPLALDYLAQLRECSLVLAEEDGDATRFRMLETVREYAAEQLEAAGETAALRRQHAEFFLVLAEQAAAAHGPEQMEWINRLEIEHDNMRAALARCQAETTGVEAGLRLASALEWLWLRRGPVTEARQWLAQLLSRGGELSLTVRLKALTQSAGLANFQMDFPTADALAAEALALAREATDRQLIADCLSSGVRMLFARGRPEWAAAMTEEGLALAREVGEPGPIANWLLWHAWAATNQCVATNQGDEELALSLYMESLALFRELGDKAGIARVLPYCAQHYWFSGNVDQAKAMLQEALAVNRQLGDPYAIVGGLASLGHFAREQDEYVLARAHFEERLAVSRELRDKLLMVGALLELAQVAHAQGDATKARDLLAEARPLCQELGDKNGEANACMVEGDLLLDLGDYAAARSCYEEGLAMRRAAGQTWAAAWALLSVGQAAWLQGEPDVAHSRAQEALAIFQKMGNKSAIARSLSDMGRAVGNLGDLAAARQLLEESLAIYRERGEKEKKGGIARVLERWAAVAVTQAQSGRAARLIGAAQGLREAIGALLLPAERAGYDRCVAALRTALGEEGLAAAWAEGRALTLEDAIKYALEK